MKGLCPECETFHKPNEPCSGSKLPWKTLMYSVYNGKISLGSDPPFDGKPILIRTNTGVVEAWWQDWESTPSLEDPNDGEGFQWVCYDDAFQCDLDDVLEWMLIP